ncbi:acyl-CoA synthetase (AMP-forming)/AMP-acid ligase II [Caldisphaera lagunensis DSM 15908]|uniref:Acyl-CoA synthetase (AMP-forming)/AMP-acid ligase II n=1 Tax=Caldisphaera lagunensis (strain DSM 15908 / JCM 11604 / ANMR 0165 / IC-154) TaxID=1056495 RepID=L0AA07_CALLD|nr:AMP-binding protein [Caldisphaera lagunensis]AFZ69885.1 acyl-CoA synthetase (AMP-forming)/AMP-acid ligase II [Caldisphaera lagunensis DSM 15908]
MYTFEYILRRASQLFPDQEIIDVNGRKTYKETYKETLNLITYLKSLGIKRGDVVSIIGLNNIKFFELIYAITTIGGIAYPINIRLPPDQLIYTLNKSSSRYFIYENIFKELADLVKSKINIETVSFNELKFNLGEGKPVSNKNDDAIILFTSGTTGLPKAVLYNQEKMINGALSILNQLTYYNAPAKLSQNDVMFPQIPIYHILSWGSLIIAPLIGAKLIYGGKFDPKIAIEIIEKENVTWISVVPTMMQMLLDTGLSKRGLKVLIGGSPIPDGLVKKMKDLDIHFSAIYGGTDMLAASITIETKHVKNGILDYHKVTHPVPMAEFYIDSKSQNQPGEIWFRAPWMPNGYYNDKEKTMESFTPDGWFKTGDIGYIAEDGGLIVLDRVKDIIKSGGEWIPSSVLEASISELPFISLVAVIAKKDEKWGERPIAVVKLSKETQNAKELIYEHLRKYVNEGKLSKFWLPDDIIIVNDIPLTGTGKIDKKNLKEILKNYNK